MSRVMEETIGRLLDEAEERASCLAPGAGTCGSLWRALERRVEGGALVSPLRGLFFRTETWESLTADQRARHLARGLQLLHPSWVFCGPTAAAIYGVDVSFSLLRSIHVATPAGTHGGGAPIARHPVLPADEGSRRIEVVDGLRVTSPEQTVLDCLRWADFARGLGIADSALRLGVTGRSELIDHAEREMGRLRGVGHALRTLEWADPRSESGGESIARARMLLLGFACPELQVEVPRVVEGGQPFRADYCWVRTDGVVILGELDGRAKYVDARMTGGRDLEAILSDENIRGSRFTLFDVSLVRFRFEQTERPAEFAAILDEYGVPRRGSDLDFPPGVPMVPDWESLRRTRGD